MDKYALFKYQNSNNIGDEIQSIAARRFLPTVDYYIDRDGVGEWKNENPKETVKLITNGWYMHEPYTWPISDKTISPLMLSMHVNGTDEKVTSTIGSKKSRKYMNHFGPVGARDFTTEKFFSKSGIKTYFSACLTLTLQRDPKVKAQDYILAVSVSDETYRFIKKNTSKRVIRFNPYVNRGIDNIEKTKIAEYILFLYQSASCVVTTKVHAMLPSLALETPVLFVDEDETFDPSRLNGLVELVNSVTKHDLLVGKFTYDFEKPPHNPETYKAHRRDLVKRCEAFTGYKNNRSFMRMIDISEIDQSSIPSKIPITDNELSASEMVQSIKPPTFSVVMPAYNIAGYIAEAVTSIKGQSFTDFECIIVDDGSTDGGVKGIAHIAEDDKRFKILTQKNGGLSNARNNGYALSTGDYVLFLDGDDVFSENLLERAYEKIVETQADVIVFNHSVLDNITGHVTKGVHYLSELANKKSVTPQQISKNIFNIFGNQVWTKAFKRELIEKHKLQFNEKLKRAEDIPFTYSALIFARKIGVIDDSLVSYRTNRGDSNSDSLAKYYKDIFVSLDMLHDVIMGQKDPQKYQSSFNKLFLENVYYNLRSLVGSRRFEDEFKLSQKYLERFNIAARSEESSGGFLADVYDILHKKDYVEMLVYMLDKEKKEAVDRQTTIYHLETHIMQLKTTLMQNNEKIIRLENRYARLRQSHDQILRIPRKLKREIKRMRNVTGNEKTS